MTKDPCTICLRCLTVMLCALGMTSQAAARAEAFHISHLNVAKFGNELRLDARISYRLNETVVEALRNGIPMQFQQEVQVQILRKWLWNRTVSSVRQTHALKYHALSKQYILEDLNRAVTEVFPDLDSALMRQGRIHAMYIGEADSLNRERPHVVQLRSRLLVAKLPLPLRMESYFSSEWRLDSGWYEWPL